ncbi:hypothetical protein GOQ30_02455 [Flavobacterium sp. TP390]|uniref:Methylamine utilisation protein MauE domain-containing protein n=1 Tax=Flavobacterium profundi TaxID=1774945 RepID=A0A6I4IRY5_9FLAO|nr:MauE/DoxX family redox-associated membrane protein [Flavobacterium profundi]MVO08027.1 hypothetical protein [Flavobacterium profundi]
MNTDKLKNGTVLFISYLFILLFVYAAVSKFLDYDNFQVQLGQSPLLSAYAGFVVWMIPLLELVIAVLLAVKQFRVIGLYASLGLMVLFSSYIYLILNYSSYVPCSCGGILEKMNWHEHLYFNLFFTLLSLFALFLLQNTKRSYVIRSLLIVLVGFFLVVLLFITSDYIIHKHNNFVRNYIPKTVQLATTKDLAFNSYYFAGKSTAKIYLGNRTAPALITKLSADLKSTQSYHIAISDTLYPFRSIQLRVHPPYFYLWDGTVPCLFQGDLATTQARLLSDKAYGFTKAEVIDSTRLVIRTINNSGENVLATLSLQNGAIQKFAPALLEKQIDGLFDTDGTLHYSAAQQKFVYLYYYRNQYVVADKNLTLLYKGNTIDTTSQAKIKVTYVKHRNQKKFSAPPQMVNRISALHNNLLFVNSTLPGRFDVKKVWDQSSVIDVYDISSQRYLISFYIKNIDGVTLNDIVVTDTHFYALIGTHIVSYSLGDEIRKHYQTY